MKPFFYDVMMKRRPWVTELLAPDVTYLKNKNIKSIRSCDDEPLQTRFLRYVRRSLPPLEKWLGPASSPDHRARFYEMIQSRPPLMTAFRALEMEYCALINFELSGRKVFHFDGALVDKLVATEADAPSELLRLPFPSCFFVVDYPPFLDLYESITNSEKLSREAPVSINLTEFEDIDGLHVAFLVSRPDYKTFENPAYIDRGWLISPGKKVEDALRTEWPVDVTGPPVEYEDDLQFLSRGHLTFFRTIANCILYLSSATADLAFEKSPLIAEIEKLRAASRHWKKQAKQHISLTRAQYSRLDYTHVGGKIAVAPFRPFLMGDGIEGLRRVLIKRLMVRGHWRNQPYGPQSTLRKLIFVEPYWRGPELADEINKPYEVKL